jgi:hypothetical protein
MIQKIITSISSWISDIFFDVEDVANFVGEAANL